MKECDKSTRKIHISINFILSISLLIMFDTLLLRPSLHCNTLLHFTTFHPTTLHYNSLHFTLQHSSQNYNSLHFTLQHSSPNYTSLHFDTLPPSTLHYTYQHFTSSHLHSTALSFSFTLLHFLSFYFVQERHKHVWLKYQKHTRVIYSQTLLHRDAMRSVNLTSFLQTTSHN
jgi:hypothetical protein